MLEILYTLIVTHLTIICVTLYLHRSQTHRSVTFTPVINHLMRFWLWLTTGMITAQWVAVHRLHHAHTETPDDPHSPKHHGLRRVLFGGALLYTRAAKEKLTITNLSRDCPQDWIERNLYTKYHWLGLIMLLLINFLLFGWWGFLIWGIQAVWIPFWAAGVVNGLGHFYGYRNGETRDNSHNILPWGIIIAGEELHNNHHLTPAAAKLSHRPWEFDLGWFYIRVLEKLGLATVKQP
jgi:stearoyl-CoA desaturase (delta-9 desaturase)